MSGKLHAFCSPPPGSVFEIGAVVGGLRIGIAYAEGLCFKGRSVFMHLPFELDPSSGGNGITALRASLSERQRRIPYSELIIKTVPRQPWMDLTLDDFRPVWRLLKLLPEDPPCA